MQQSAPQKYVRLMGRRMDFPDKGRERGRRQLVGETRLNKKNEKTREGLDAEHDRRKGDPEKVPDKRPRATKKKLSGAGEERGKRKI